MASTVYYSGIETLRQDFKTEYAKALKMLPAWFILFMSQKGTCVPYTSKDNTLKFKRDSTLLNEWFIGQNHIDMLNQQAGYRGASAGFSHTAEPFSKGYSEFSGREFYVLCPEIVHDHKVVSLFCEADRASPLPTVEDLYADKHQAGCSIQ